MKYLLKEKKYIFSILGIIVGITIIVILCVKIVNRQAIKRSQAETKKYIELEKNFGDLFNNDTIRRKYNKY